MSKLLTIIIIAGLLYAGSLIGKQGVTQQIKIMSEHHAQLEAIR